MLASPMSVPSSAETDPAPIDQGDVTAVATATAGVEGLDDDRVRSVE